MKKEMKKLHLILPPFPFSRREVILPLNLGYLAAVISGEYDVELFDANALGYSPRTFYNKIRESNSDALLFTAHTYQFPYVTKAASIAKRKNKGALTVIGGPHASALPEQTLEECPDLDIAVVGEGEYALPEILTARRTGGEFEKIPGIVFRRGTELIRTTPRGPIEDLDALPMPAWDRFDLSRYSGFYPLSGMQIPILTTRGCPYDCRFCNRVLGDKVRYRSIASVADEIDRALAMGIHQFVFLDETFTVRRERVEEICRYLIGAGKARPIRWIAQTRVDLFDDDLAALMKESGCEAINFGFESGNSEVLQSHRKRIAPSDIRNAAEVSRGHGIKILANVMFGSPLETRASLQDTKRLIFDIKPDRLAVNQLIAFPGTDIYRAAKNGEENMRLLDGDWARFHPQIRSNVVFRNVSQRRISWEQLTTYLRFYLFFAGKNSARQSINLLTVRQFLSNVVRVIFG
jgi:anaerobic magnesium-protoporphyrin IX monomethyl ester cyclase